MACDGFIVSNRPLTAACAGLAAAVLMLGGLSAVRVNITVGPDGIEHEAMFSTRRIAWGDIATLETLPRRTGMLGGQRCTVRGWNSVIKFSPDDYEEGFLLASLIAQASGKEWGPPGSPIACRRTTPNRGCARICALDGPGATDRRGRAAR